MGDSEQQLFAYNDPVSDSKGVNADGTQDEMVEFFEVYEKLKVPHVNVFHRIEPNAKEIKAIKEQVKVKLMEMEKETLRLYEDSKVKFKFRYHPEYIETGMKVLFREGKTKGTGEIIEIINYLKN